MADQESIKNQQEENKLLREGVTLARDMEEVRRRDIQNTAGILEDQRSIVYELRDALGIRTRIADEERKIFSLAKQVATQASISNSELRESKSLYTAIRKETRLRAQTETEIASLAKKIGNESGNSVKLAKEIAKQQAAVNKERSKSSKILDTINLIEEQTGKAASDNLYRQFIIQEGIADAQAEILANIFQQADQETIRLASLFNQLEVLDKLSGKRQLAVEEERKINSALGITGALLDNLNKIGIRAFGGLGLNLAAFGVELGKAKEDADQAAEVLALTEAGKGLTDFQKRLITMRFSLPGIRNAVKEAFNDPLSIAVAGLTLLKNSIISFSDDTSKLTRLVGDAGKEQLRSVGNLNASYKDVFAVVTAITNELGVNAATAFERSLLIDAAELTTLMGMTAEEAARFAEIAQVTGTDIDDNTDQIIRSVNGFNALNKSAVNHRTIMKDVANASKALSLTLGNDHESIAKAAAAARNLGLELKDLEGIASSLLDFESSIEAELSAQLLSGKQINLSKARELGMMGDMEGLASELGKQEAVREAFASRNVIEQNSIAQALGISRDQLAQIVYAQARQNNLSGEALEKATGMTKEQLEQLSINERLENVTDKIKQLTAEYGILIAGVAITYKVIKDLAQLSASIEVIRNGIAAVRARSDAKSAAASVTEAAADSVSAAAEGGKSVAKIPYVGGFLAVGVASAILGFLLGKLTNLKDGMIAPDGGLMVSGPKGSYQLDKDDYVIAGTELGGSSVSEETRTGGRGLKALNEKLDTLIQVTRNKQNIYLNNRLVGEVTERQVIGATNFT